MKILKFFPILFVCFGFLVACNSNSKEVKDEKTEMVSYGEVAVDTKKAISVNELLSQMENSKEEKEFTINAEIAEVCSKMGCWINVKKSDESTFMVRFKDHFVIPPTTKIGTSAIIHGIAYWDTIPVERLQHFAEDAGKSKQEISKITEPSFELAFEADGITFQAIKKEK